MSRTRGTGGITRLEQKPKGRCRAWRLEWRSPGEKARYRRFRGTYAQAEKALAAFGEEVEAANAEPDATFGEYLERWMLRREIGGEIADSTIDKDKTTARRLAAEFGGMRLRGIAPGDVQDGMARIRNASPTGRPLSGTTMSKTFALMKQVLRSAQVEGLVEKNPMELLKAPRKSERTRRAVPFDQVEASLQAIEALPLDGRTVAVRLMVLGGLRRSECVGLEWGDVRGGMVRVCRSVRERTGEVAPTKTAAGVRSVPMLPQLAASLDAWKVAQAEKLAFLGIEQTDSTPVCSSDSGTRLAAQNLYRWWRSNRAALGMEGYSLHELRHTFLTMLANSGAGAQAVKSIAGWSGISMADVYVHDDDAANAEAVGLLERRLGGGETYRP